MKYFFFVTDFNQPIKTNGVIQGYTDAPHWFDTFEEYWEYRRLQAKKLDEDGYIQRRPDGSEERILTNYASRYI